MVQRLRANRHEHLDEVTNYIVSVKAPLADLNKKVKAAQLPEL